MTESETQISKLNSSFFFREFTFSSNRFRFNNKGEELELADNVVWIDDLLLITQIKERNKSAGENIERWFKNKVLRKAVKQIKNTIKYFDTYKDISITNEKGHILNVGKARTANPIKLIIYSPGDSFPDSLRFLKFYKSRDVGYIHLFHIEDYLWICKYLITPFEIKEYLDFRKLLFQNHEKIIDILPEQYVLGHYIQTLDTTHINLEYIENLKNLVHDEEEFDISFIIENFNDRIRINPEGVDYYVVIKELAKLNRSELREFKKRYILSIEKSKEQKFILPYRITSLNTACGFVFIPIEFSRKDKWQIALNNYTEAHKYEQKLDKCIGMIVYHNPEEMFFDINWCYLEFEWERDLKYEKILIDNFPFRTVRKNKTFRYFLNEN